MKRGMSDLSMYRDMSEPKRRPQRLRALELAATTRWALSPDWVHTILSIAARQNDVDFDAIEARRGKALENTQFSSVRDGVAIIPIAGPMFRYANLFTWMSGATSIEEVACEFTSALDNPMVRAIVLTIDSPGGQVNGTSELADLIFNARGRKPIVAYVNNAALSAAYWIASACDQIIVDPTSGLGSIGVVAVVANPREEQVESMEIVSSQSPRKRLDPKTDEGQAALQDEVDAIADVFVARVARNRGVSTEGVLRDFGSGGTIIGERAVKAGLADEVGTLETIIERLASQETVTMARSQKVIAAKLEAQPTASAAMNLFPATVAEAAPPATEPTDEEKKDEAPKPAAAEPAPSDPEPDPEDPEEDTEDPEEEDPKDMPDGAPMALAGGAPHLTAFNPADAEVVKLRMEIFQRDFASRLGRDPMAAGVALYGQILQGKRVEPKAFTDFVAMFPPVPGGKLPIPTATAAMSGDEDAVHFEALRQLREKGITPSHASFRREYNAMSAKLRHGATR